MQLYIFKTADQTIKHRIDSRSNHALFQTHVQNFPLERIHSPENQHQIQEFVVCSVFPFSRIQFQVLCYSHHRTNSNTASSASLTWDCVGAAAKSITWQRQGQGQITAYTLTQQETHFLSAVVKWTQVQYLIKGRQTDGIWRSANGEDLRYILLGETECCVNMAMLHAPKSCFVVDTMSTTHYDGTDLYINPHIIYPLYI